MPLDQQRSAGGGQDEPLLRVQDLSVVFPTRKQRLVAVDEVSFNIRRGEILGVVGESGAGKSITGNAVMSLIEPPGFVSGGGVYLDGERIDNLSELADFKLFRLTPTGGRYVKGFGRAYTLEGGTLAGGDIGHLREGHKKRDVA